jgi:Tfp pilus assembly protein PilV
MLKTKKKYKKYKGFSLIQMLISIIILAIILLAINNVIVTMIRTSNTISSRMLVREESEYIAEVMRKYLRNSSADNVRLYVRSNPRISLSINGEVNSITGDLKEIEWNNSEIGTEIHFRSSADSENKVICIGYFENHDVDSPVIGYVMRSVNEINTERGWSDYQPSNCFPGEPQMNDIFRKNIAFLNSDLISIEDLSIRRDRTNVQVFYSIDIDVRPVWGVGGLSNYRDEDGAPKYRKSFVVQTRQFFHW